MAPPGRHLCGMGLFRQTTQAPTGGHHQIDVSPILRNDAPISRRLVYAQQALLPYAYLAGEYVCVQERDYVVRRKYLDAARGLLLLAQNMF
jgi:hypothetical protein